MPQFDLSLVWFRRDLRSFDHAALHQALMRSRRVHCAFIFDTRILKELPPHDRRVDFIHGSLIELERELRELGGTLIVRHGDAALEIAALAAQLGVDAVFANRDYEPAAVRRDRDAEARLSADGRAFVSCKDQVIFEKDEVVSKAGTPFSVFTPYKKAWLKRLHADPDDAAIRPHAVDACRERLARPPRPSPLPSLEDLGFVRTDLRELGVAPGMSGGQAFLDAFLPRLARYHVDRDFPSVQGTSCLSVHLRFGTVSPRALVRLALERLRLAGGEGAATWLSELIWRDFYFMILHHHPRVESQAFKPQYDKIAWESGAEADARFRAWCDGNTGYPLVDAAMRQLNETGFMHNRLRMVTACFLIKDLGIDWRRGERYFAERLNDYDLAANNGGWQWAASSGCDAQPYFRIFNPVTQSEKFDPDGAFILRYLPQLARLRGKFRHAPWLASPAMLAGAGLVLGKDYPFPLVAHDDARQATLTRYAVVKKTPAAGVEADAETDADDRA